MIIIRIRLFIVTIITLFSITTFFSNDLFAITKPDRKIVVFNEYVTPSRKQELLKKHCVEKVKEVSGINGIVVNLSKGNKLKDEIDVAYIEDDFVLSVCKNYKTDQSPISPTRPVTEEIIPWGVSYMEAPQYWDTADTDNIRVGILDTGIDLNHPDIKENIKGGFNALRRNKPASDDNGHGTHTAGILAASRNNFGVVGMIPDVNLYPIKVLDSNGNGYVSDIIDGIEWAISNRMDFLNMSFGTINDSQSLHEAIIRAKNAGIVLVAAAGNNYGGSCEYPAAYSEVLSVGAISKDGNIAPFSAQEGVDVFAPGEDIYSTYLQNTYLSMGGTSAAVPHIVGKLCFERSCNQ